MYFDSNDDLAQPGGFRQSRITGAMQFVATPHTVMTPEQWRQHVEHAGQVDERLTLNERGVAVIEAGSRDVRIRIGGR